MRNNLPETLKRSDFSLNGDHISYITNFLHFLNENLFNQRNNSSFLLSILGSWKFCSQQISFSISVFKNVVFLFASFPQYSKLPRQPRTKYMYMYWIHTITGCVYSYIEVDVRLNTCEDLTWFTWHHYTAVFTPTIHYHACAVVVLSLQ